MQSSTSRGRNIPGRSSERESQAKYESAVKPIPDPSGWFHARIEVTKQKVSVWVDDAKEPCLVVDRLASQREERWDCGWTARKARSAI